MKSLQYSYNTSLYLNVLHGVFFLSVSVSLSHTLSASLADQQTNAASLDRALSHTAVFFFYVWLFTTLMSDTFFFLEWTLYSLPAELSRWMAGGMRVFPCHLLIICMDPPSWLKWSRCLLLALWGLSHTTHTHTRTRILNFQLSRPHNNSLLQLG